VPLIAFEPGEPVGDVRGFDWIAVTSRNAVDALFSNLTDARDLAGIRIAAVGPGTAAALRSRGILADLVPSSSNAEGLVAAFADGPGSVLLPQSSIARPTLAEGLRAKGWDVTVVPAYRTVPAPLDDVARDALRGADLVALTSSSTAENLAAALADAAEAAAVRVVAIGPATAATAHACGFEVVAVAEQHDLDGLVAAILGTA